MALARLTLAAERAPAFREHAATEQLMSTTRLLVDGLVCRMRAQGVEVDLSRAAIEHLAEVGFDPDFGARTLRRAIQRGVENELSRLVLRSDLQDGDRVNVDASNGALRFASTSAASATATWPTGKSRARRRTDTRRAPRRPADEGSG